MHGAVSKYRNERVVIDGVNFASKREGKRYSDLKLLTRAHQITALTLQPRFPLIVNDVLIATYVGDFEYVERGKRVCEDSKGFKTPEYKIKIKLAKVLYPDVEFREV